MGPCFRSPIQLVKFRLELPGSRAVIGDQAAVGIPARRQSVFGEPIQFPPKVIARAFHPVPVNPRYEPAERVSHGLGPQACKRVGVAAVCFAHGWSLQEWTDDGTHAVAQVSPVGP